MHKAKIVPCPDNIEGCAILHQIWEDEKSVNEAKHFDEGKIQFEYIFTMSGLDDVAKVGTFGAQKYGHWNYRVGSTYMRFLGSCCRHLIAFIRGENFDKESGHPHLAHLIFDALIIMQWMHDGVGLDDRYKEPILKSHGVQSVDHHND